MSDDKALHWDAAYESRGESGVSWFQTVPTVSIDLIDLLEASTDAAVLDIGGGASSLVDHLVGRGFTDLTVLDIAEKALATARNRLGANAPVSWLHEDLLQWTPDRRFDLWHDRAVFHFLVEDHERQKYLEKLKGVLRPGGSVIIATFAEDGPEFCSSLPVCRYSADELSSLLGDRFKVIATRREEHRTPTLARQSFTWVAATLPALGKT
jgi:ubiquinone/menaquinone biosynthesis C-methylase UbiE